MIPFAERRGYIAACAALVVLYLVIVAAGPPRHAAIATIIVLVWALVDWVRIWRRRRPASSKYGDIPDDVPWIDRQGRVRS